MLEALRNGVYALTGSGLDALLRPVLGGVGVILTFHRLVPEPPTSRHGPSHSLVVTEDAFRAVVAFLRKAGYEIVSLDEVRRRLLDGAKGRKFACLTFDDGYIDNHELAYPICRELEVPFTIYVTINMIENKLLMWWYGLERVIEQLDFVECPTNGSVHSSACRTSSEKIAAYRSFDQLLRLAPDTDRVQMIEHLEQESDVDFAATSRGQALTWDMIEEMGRNDIVTIGAHTVTHRALRTLSDDEVRMELGDSRAILEKHLNKPVRHFAYPFGRAIDAGEREFTICGEVGFDTGTTTQPGTLKASHRDSLHHLPRINMFPERTVQAMRAELTGIPTTLKNAYHAVSGS